ncbi:SusC/RagA family TonB-linked outer membrane protein [Chitinophaga pendula]|uniref:SusC/RagA family TonB-linked outer membrane protein n=1 Tax=Chitinophaga TaxID=79328 RepID=UPI000BAE7E1F|nr:MULTISPECIES: SusC/RagA family TonB-linked outer membrane protein [Chitinophaga]ASZ11746.1 SusC/RagA family TonB-linked outer membrane protein [Chitinophaga sp. MD30]UCJ05234.1 SusC/RagA family TonB-linked outer membrane protein [Chitinophaga pendula]
MLLFRSTLMALVLITCAFALYAQQSLTGKVTDAVSGKGLPGVTIRVPNTSKGTITDVNGQFNLATPAGTSQLILTFTGYKTKTVAVGNSNTLNITMEEDYAKLDEVVVTGLATTVKRSNLANAVATISAKDLAGTAPAQTFDAALSGKIPGALITANSGAPGGGISVKLRGITSIFSNSQPLYVVDGVFVSNVSIPAGLNDITGAATAGNPQNQDNPSSRIADLNPQDIQNIEILKGASAAALYGSKAAAGVIIITTKRGKAGKTQFSVNQETGLVKVRKLLGVRQFTPETAADLAGAASSTDPAVQAARARNRQDFLAAQAAGKIYDYEKEIYGQTGLLLNTSLSASGGSEKTTFFFSANRRSEDGIIKRTGYLNNSLRLNIDHKVSDRVSLGFTSNYINSSSDRGLSNNDNNGVSLGVALASTPGFVELHPTANGLYPRNRFAASNPLETRDKMTNNENTNRFITSINFDAKVQQSNKSNTRLIVRGGVDFFNLKTAAIFPRSLQFMENTLQGASIQGNTNNTNTNLAGFIVNVFSPSEKLNLTSTIGATLETGNLDNIVVASTKLVGTQTNVDQAGASNPRQFRQKYRDNGIFIQEELTLLDAITATAGLRFDRSTNNGDFKKYYLYPKGALSWNIAKMDFWHSKQINSLKLRVAYGQSGNVSPYGAKFTSLVGSNTGGFPGSLVDNQLGNPNILPEKQTELEAGVDISILDGRVSLEATFYNKKIFDLLLRRATPGSTGYTTQWVNGGDLRNRGVELGLSLIPVNTKNVKWTANINWWKNQSRITRLEIPAFSLGAFGNSLGTFFIEEGKSATQIKGTVKDKVGLQTLGNAEPDFQMSFMNEVTLWRNLTFRFLVHWKKGGDNINLTELLSDLGGTTPDYDDDKNGNGIKDGLERTNAGDASIFVQDASYVRIREIGIYYNLPLHNTKYIRALRFGISANNWFTFTDYKSYDPESSNFGSNTLSTGTSRGSSGISTGVEVMPFPASKRASFHVGIDF